MKYLVSFFLLLILSSVSTKAQQEIKGVTTIGGSTITETVGDIMARQIIGAQPIRSNELEKEKEYPDRSNLPQNPNSPQVSSYSASNIKINQQANSLTSLTKGLNFLTATLSGTYSTNCYPPDNMGCVGPTQYIVGVNGRFVSFNKTTGAADGAINTGTDNFFASVMNPEDSTFTSDPHIRYDRLSKRWIFIIIDVPGGLGEVANRVLLGVSADSIITSSTVINFFYFQYTGSNFIDYPTLGIDANALYIGGNFFELTSGSYAGGFAMVVQKNSILGTGPMVSTQFNVGTASSGIFTPQGVDNLYNPGATEGYFIGVDEATLGKLDLYRVTNPGTTSPSLSSAVSITVPATAQPGTFYAKPGASSNKLDPDDDRLFAAMIRNGHLWTAHHIEVTSAGVGSSSGGRIGARWYDLINYPTGSTPALNQSGTIYSGVISTSNRDKNFAYPSITVNGQGHAVMGFTIAGYYSYANAGYTFRLASNAAGTMQAPDSNTASTYAYNPSGESAPHRWGDYSHTDIDPYDDMTFWTIQQVVNATDSYGCQVLKLMAPAPAALISATPGVIGPGSNLTLVIKGDTTTGLGFFEPGSSFLKHLTVSIDSGIVVNSVNYNSPSTITLNVTTTGAKEGARTITITNPDGQSVSSSILLKYDSTLPVELAAFTAEVIRANEIQLNWSTATEVNSQKFAVERSIDKNNWTTLTSVNAAGNSNKTVNYFYIDKSQLSQGTYYYRLKQYDNDGAFKELNTIEVDYSNVPSAFGLSQNYPNPFNPSTRISFQVPVKSNVNVSVYDILGHKVATLVNETKQPGQYDITFDSSHLSSGVYFYKMQSDKFVITKKMTVIK
jgi:hypothetical protein